MVRGALRCSFRCSFAVLVVVSLLSAGCAVTNYPLIRDTRGPVEDEVVDTYYDKAYVIPSGQVATIFGDGSDETFTLVTQDWKGDRRLFTYDNFDPTASVIFLDQTYCDPTRQTNCAVATAWDPDLPETVIADPSDPVERDEIFDYVYDGRCAGSRSLCMFIAMPERIGECGSGLWREKQDLAAEFARLAMSEFRGRSVYHLPMSSEAMSVSMGDGTNMPIYGRHDGYITERLQLILPLGPNARYQARWLDRWIRRNGPYLDLTVTYGSLTAQFRMKVGSIDAWLDRL